MLPACEASRAYLEAAARFVRDAGLELAPATPICLPPGAVGDAADRVHPALKERYSELYRLAAAAVAPELRARPAVDGSRPGTRARHLR
jgi:hypothetical protein